VLRFLVLAPLGEALVLLAGFFVLREMIFCLTTSKLFSAEESPSASKQALQNFCFHRIPIPYPQRGHIGTFGLISAIIS